MLLPHFITCLFALTCFSPRLNPENEVFNNDIDVTPSSHIVDIIIKVKNKHSALESCLDSLLQHAPDTGTLRQRIILINDGSKANSTIEYQKSLCKSNPSMFFCLFTDISMRGHTKAVVKGINFGATLKPPSTAIVHLDVDTIVTENWLLHLYQGLMNSSDEKVSIVGPLSNAAGFQSVPLQWSGPSLSPPHTLPPGMNVNLLGQLVSTFSMQQSGHTIVNGFCMMFKRSLIAAIGSFDYERFPTGYGSDMDFVMRAGRAGHEAHILTNAYVYHTGLSDGISRKSIKAADMELANLYGQSSVDALATHAQQSISLAGVRSAVAAQYATYMEKYSAVTAPVSIIFILLDVGVSGGTISVVTEAHQMRLYGVNVTLAVPRTAALGRPLHVVRKLLPGIEEATLHQLVLVYTSLQALIKIARTYDIVVATHFKTMRTAQAVVEARSGPMLAYYAQDYEPWFMLSPFHSKRTVLSARGKADYEEARQSYTVNNRDLVIVAKTKWTASMIEEHHGMSVAPVVGSMNHNIYYPNHTMVAWKLKKTFATDTFHIVAMVRPKTERRNPISTLDILLRLAYEYPRNIRITIFGCTRPQLTTVMTRLVTNRKSTEVHRSWDVFHRDSIQFVSVLKNRFDVANMFRSADLFLDLSWWQAFGRSGLEAMACGCVAVMPQTGASSEICGNGTNCLAHDGKDVEGYFRKVESILHNDRVRHDLIRNGMKRTWEYTIEEAAASMAVQLKGAYMRRIARA